MQQIVLCLVDEILVETYVLTLTVTPVQTGIRIRLYLNLSRVVILSLVLSRYQIPYFLLLLSFRRLKNSSSPGIQSRILKHKQNGHVPTI